MTTARRHTRHCNQLTASATRRAARQLQRFVRQPLTGYISTDILNSEMAEKPLRWVGSSLEDLRAFPAEARREAGYQLYRVQLGMMPDDWKSMTSVGRGVYEIRVRTAGEHRVFYIARFEEAVYVLHAFQKRTQRTRKADIDLGALRLAEVLRVRRRR